MKKKGRLYHIAVIRMIDGTMVSFNSKTYFSKLKVHLLKILFN